MRRRHDGLDAITSPGHSHVHPKCLALFKVFKVKCALALVIVVVSDALKG